jgi:hypothetical protein
MHQCEMVNCSDWNGTNCEHDGPCWHREESGVIAELEAENAALRDALRALVVRCESAEAAIGAAATHFGPHEKGERCPICDQIICAAWCWYPKVLDWDDLQYRDKSLAKAQALLEQKS